MKELKSLKLVALDIDGPCVMDTFSPVIRLVVHKLGGEYTAEIERNVFSQNRLKAAQFLIAKLNLNIGAEELIGMYFKERAAYEESVEHGINVGLGEFIGLLENLGLRLICYGGLDKNYF
ncbi:MAG: hypothetical protein KDK37_04535, partial [Leptospiraceae bacterium]|nr:hypothetical protein [Leptospiraceae bacterium]